MTFVVRSMSTTDFDVVRGIKPVPYHVYLVKPEKRLRAYWSTFCNDVQTFATVAEAEAEIDRAFKQRDKWWRRPEIVPVRDGDLPTYWENQKANRRAVGTETVEI